MAISTIESINVKKNAHQSGVPQKMLFAICALILAIISTYFVLTSKSNDFAISLFYSLILIVLGGFAFYLAPQKHRHFLALLLISIGAIIFGGLNGGLFSIGAGAIFWPVFAGLAFKSPRKLGMSANLLTFICVALLGFITGKVPNTDNPMLPSLFSLGISALVLNFIYSANTWPIFQKAQLKELENAKTEAQNAKTQIQARTNFIAEMSHEIRTPLNHILGFSGIMVDELYGPLNNQYKEYATLINQSGKHLSDLVGDILDMSKIEAGRYKLDSEVFDVTALTGETTKLSIGSAYSNGLDLQFYGNEALFINADKRAIRQILLNLLSNATKFTPKDGKISVRTYGDKDHVWIEVSDTGRGMSAQEISQIGEPYLHGQSNDGSHRSTGLGLSLVKKLTEMQGGKFIVHSQIDKGTNMILEFSRKQA